MHNLFHNIDDVMIPFDSDWNDVAISVSGGADSALLAYLICTLAKDQNITIHIINHVRMWKTRPWQQHDADRVYSWLSQKFCHTTFKRHVNFIAPDIEYGNTGPNLTDEYGKKVSGDNIQQRAYAEFICHKHNISAYYNAVTRNPRQSMFNGMLERDVEPTDKNKHLEYMVHMNRIASHPFRFVDKSWVIKQYKRLGIEELLNLTRSCEGEFDGIDYTTYKTGQHVPICGKCFWCKEREWALDQSK
jgi:hypothetical protein